MEKNEIETLLKKKIQEFEFEPTVEEIGYVISVRDGIAKVVGLDDAFFKEVVIFSKNKVKGLILSLEIDYAVVLILDNDHLVSANEEVVRTKQPFKIKVGETLLGHIINGFGEIIDHKINLTSEQTVFNNAPTIMSRRILDKQLETGIRIIDLMLPIGLGQRMLILGSSGTGKTMIAIDTIINNKNNDKFVAIYVSINQKQSANAYFLDIMKKYNVNNYIMVVANGSDPISMSYLAPFVGCAIGEYFRDLGNDALIIYDDLASHANAYRQISNIIGLTPGREAYPGDIFYLHSGLLERAAAMNIDYRGGSLTALPIARIFNNEITGYITTNLISITDGQLILNNEITNDFKPAIDVRISVSRVGNSIQNPIIKKLASNLKIQYVKGLIIKENSKLLQSEHCSTNTILNKFNILNHFFVQNKHCTTPIWKLIMLVHLFESNYVRNINDFDLYFNALDVLEADQSNILKGAELDKYTSKVLEYVSY